MSAEQGPLVHSPLQSVVWKYSRGINAQEHSSTKQTQEGMKRLPANSKRRDAFGGKNWKDGCIAGRAHTLRRKSIERQKARLTF